jgi:hypothetical protein
MGSRNGRYNLLTTLNYLYVVKQSKFLEIFVDSLIYNSAETAETAETTLFVTHREVFKR